MVDPLNCLVLVLTCDGSLDRSLTVDPLNTLRRRRGRVGQLELTLWPR